MLKINSSIIKNDLFLSFLFSILYVVVLYSFCTPYWETNDDVFMSMCAHGYGLFNYGAPQIVFSNVVWGYIVRAIPTINGVLGYSIGQISLIVICGSVLIYFLRKLNYSWVVAICVFIIVTTNPLVFPQFTKTASFAAIISVLFLYFYFILDKKNYYYLFCGFIFGILSFFIRSQSFLMIYLFLPIVLPFRKIIKSKAFISFALAMFTLISILYYTDYQSYNNQNYKLFNEFNLIRGLFSDFKVLSVNLNDSKYKHVFSENDIKLLERFFSLHLVDSPKSIDALTKLVKDAKFKFPSTNVFFSNMYNSLIGKTNIRSLIFNSELSKFFMFLIFLSILIYTRSKKLFLAFLLIIFIVAFFSLMNKIPPNRLTFMLFAFLLILSLLTLFHELKYFPIKINTVIIISATVVLCKYYKEDFHKNKLSKENVLEISRLTSGDYLIVNGFQSNGFFRVLCKKNYLNNLKIYGGNLSPLLPNGNKYDLNKICEYKFIFIDNYNDITLLKTLFNEKFLKQLEFIEINKKINLWEVKCNNIDNSKQVMIH
jgi:hypothetical protein